MRSDDASSSFSVLDWIGVVVTCAAIVVLASLSITGGTFRAMYADFGDVPLPALTTIVTQPFVPPIAALLAAAPLALALRRSPIRARRAAVVAAFVLACSFVAVCVIGFYLPIYAIAGSITE